MIILRSTSSFGDLLDTAAPAQLPAFVASGAGHAAGAVPDPGTTAGTAHYLCEDGTWAVPPSGSPAGSGGDLQLNVSGAFGATDNLKFDTANNTLKVKAVASQSTNLIECEDSTGTPTLTINGSGITVNAAGTSLELSQTGDVFGPTSLQLLNRSGANGAKFINGGLDLVDFIFGTVSGYSSNIRFEARAGGPFGSGNAQEFQLYNPIGATFYFVSGPATTQVRTGDLVVGGGTGAARVRNDGSIGPAHLSDSAAVNDSLYYSTTTNRASYKDGSGSEHSFSGTNTGDQAPSSVILTGTYAARPAAGTAGRLYLPTDWCAAYRDNGSSWDARGLVFPATDPPSAGWSFANQGTGTITQTGGGLLLSTGSGVANPSYIRSAPATPYTITALIALLPSTTDTYGGLIYRASSSGLGEMWGWDSTSAGLVNYKLGAGGAFSATYATTAAMFLAHARYLRISDDGTNRIASISPDGRNFIPIYTRARTTDFTADQVGFMVAGPAGVSTVLMSWVQG